MVDPAALSYDQRMAEVGRVRMQNADLLEKSKALFAETERLWERLAATEAVAKEAVDLLDDAKCSMLDPALKRQWAENRKRVRRVLDRSTRTDG